MLNAGKREEAVTEPVVLHHALKYGMPSSSQDLRFLQNFVMDFDTRTRNPGAHHPSPDTGHCQKVCFGLYNIKHYYYNMVYRAGSLIKQCPSLRSQLMSH